ncbi:hypothetical protein JG688_00017880 [Phytophthora aleatoria]|uniref:Uncharacterized protein n=1 Tax=Phytophthora aleatoria TaxID=2496075 RepID=A0A8J5IGR5_9STRA|nr:hypothetical protein JG688_00017880 [Phytophthora aleatoria]
MALRTRTRLGQTTPADAQEAAVQFRELVLRTIIEKQCTRLYNADQTGKFLFFLPKITNNARVSQALWIKCGNKDKVRARALLLGDSGGNKYAPFLYSRTHELNRRKSTFQQHKTEWFR